MAIGELQNSGVEIAGVPQPAATVEKNNEKSERQKIIDIYFDQTGQITPREILEFQFKDLKDEDSIAIPPEDAKKFQVMCLVKNDSTKQAQLATILASANWPAGKTDNKSKDTDEDAFNRALQLFAVASDDEELAICGVSPNSVFGGESDNPPAITLVNPRGGFWKLLMGQVVGNFPVYQTEQICSFQNAWFESAMATLPIKAMGRLQDEWSRSSGKSSPEEKKQYDGLLKLCQESWNVNFDPVNNLYTTYLNPPTYCLDAMKYVFNNQCIEPQETSSETPWWMPAQPKKTPTCPTEEIEQLFSNNLLDMKWQDWALMNSFCKPIAERGIGSRLLTRLAVFGGAIITGFLGAATTMATLARTLAYAIGWQWGFIQLWKFFANPKNVFGLWPLAKRIYHKLSDWWKHRNDPPKPKGPSGAEKPREISAPAPQPEVAVNPSPKYSLLPEAHEIVSPEVIIGTGLTYAVLRNVLFKRYAFDFVLRLVPALTGIGLIPPEIIDELGKSVDCGIRREVSPTCKQWRAERRRRAIMNDWL